MFLAHRLRTEHGKGLELAALPDEVPDVLAVEHDTAPVGEESPPRAAGLPPWFGDDRVRPAGPGRQLRKQLQPVLRGVVVERPQRRDEVPVGRTQNEPLAVIELRFVEPQRLVTVILNSSSVGPPGGPLFVSAFRM